MKVALVHDALINRGGAERVFQTFCEMFPSAPIYTSVYLPHRTLPYFKQREIRTTLLQKLVRTEGMFKASFVAGMYLMQSFRMEPCDLILSSSTFCGKYIRYKGARHICYCYTPFRLLWQRDAYIFGKSGRRARIAAPFLPVLRRWDYSVAQRIDRFVAMTAETKERIQKAYQRDSVVIPPPIDLNLYSIGSRGDYYLVVSRLEPYKRIDLVISAFNRLGLPLKIVGDGTLAADLRRSAKENISFLGNVSDNLLKKLYAECKTVIFPQREDYGLVPLEANASGKAPICFGYGGVETTMIPFNAKNGAASATALFFHEQTGESLIEAVKQFEGVDFAPGVARQNANRFGIAAFQEAMSSVINQF